MIITLLSLFIIACVAKIYIAAKMAKQDDDLFERQSRYIAELEQKIYEQENN